LVSRKSKPKNNRNRLSFGLFQFEPRKNFYGFEDPLIENVFWRFFCFFSRKFCLFRLFRYRSEIPKQTETNRKNVFGFAKQTEKNRNRLSFGLFQFEPKKKFDCFEDTLVAFLSHMQLVSLYKDDMLPFLLKPLQYSIV
jgi:hypothetical protein